jgi:hypothetical protein
VGTVRWISACLFAVLCFGKARAAGGPRAYPIERRSTKKLIDMLRGIAGPVPGVSESGMFGGFYASGDHVEGGLPPVRTPAVPPAMRELARRGPEALPLLIAHLNDRRPTGLVVGATFLGAPSSIIMWASFASEYDPRRRSVAMRYVVEPRGKKAPAPPATGYKVKVGDVCYALVGAIVNRRLEAVRYQPTGGVVINSPIQSPVLREEVEKDWRGAQRADLEASLLSDLADARNPYEARGALERLRFYFPAAYGALSGGDFVKRKAFEASSQTMYR